MIIGIDSSAKRGGLAIDDNRYFELEYVEDVPHKLKGLGIKPKELEKILITIGPGSFTGLRVGLVIAQGIAFPHNIPILGYSTFLTMIEGAPIGHILPILYARKEVVHAAHFKKTPSSTEEIFTGRVMKILDFLDYLATLHEKPIIFGNGAELNREIIEGNGYSVYPQPAVASLLIKLYRKEAPHTLNPVVPNYVAPSEAYRKKGETNLILRPMEIDDIKEISKIEEDVFLEPWDADTFYFTIIMKNCLSIVGTLDNSIISYMIGRQEGEKFHLMNIAVSKEHWRKGYGATMLNYLLQELEKNKSIKSCYLEHRINNKAAFELYKSFGFKVVGTKHGYYHNNVDGVIMEISV